MLFGSHGQTTWQNMEMWEGGGGGGPTFAGVEEIVCALLDQYKSHGHEVKGRNLYGDR